jgi:hypothetical protein
MPPLAKTVALIKDGVCELVGRIIDAAEHGDFQEKPAEPAFAAELFVDGFWFEAGTFETFEAALERIRTSCEPAKDVSPPSPSGS